MSSPNLAPTSRLSQHLIEGYFWTVSTLCLALLVLAAAHASLPGSEHGLASLAQASPERFSDLCGPLGAATVPGCADALRELRVACAAAALVLCVLLLPVLAAAARLVTLYEIAQGLVRHATFPSAPALAQTLTQT